MEMQPYDQPGAQNVKKKLMPHWGHDAGLSDSVTFPETELAKGCFFSRQVDKQSHLTI